jgi:hypothetical protein
MFRTTGAVDPHGASFIVGRLLLVKRHDLVKKTNSDGGLGKVIINWL